ncbi:MAG: GAF domain-containing protein [Phycisphaerae bacterium]
MEAVQETNERLLAWDFFYPAHRLPRSNQFRIAGVIDTIEGRRHSFPEQRDVEATFSPAVREVLSGTRLLINRQEGRPKPPMRPLGSGRLSASLMFVPVQCEGQVVGLLSAQSYTPNRYGESDLQILQDIADAIAPAMERVRAEESLRSREQLLRLERDLAVSLGAPRDVREALDRLLEMSLQIEGVDCGGAYLVHPITQDLVLACHRNRSAGFVDRVRHLACDNWRAALVLNASPFYMSTAELHATDADCLNEGLLSVAVAPVAYSDKLIAVLNLASRSLNEIPHHSRHAIEAVAAQMGATLVRIRAEQGLREARDQLEQRVEQRTAELRQANARLEAEIIERQKSEQALLEKEAQLRRLNENLADGMVYQINSGHDGQKRRFTYLSSAVEHLHGLRVADVLANPALIYDQVLEEDRPLLAEHKTRAFATRTTLDMDVRVRLPSGEIRWRRFISSPRAAADGSLMGDGIKLDITRRKTTEESLLRKERELRLLGAEANRRLEEERSRVSRELHDELGQILTALNLNLKWLGRRIGDVGDDVVERIDESIQYVSRMITSVRTLSRSLRPAALGHERLVEVVRSHIAEFEQYAGIRCKIEVMPPNLAVSEPLATIAFRIVQEALTNVARHSKATFCQVNIRAVDDLLVLEIRDNGIGLKEQEPTDAISLGIPGMRERAETVGGSLVVANNPEGGVCVTARLPRQRREYSSVGS